jgi:hypothetical protein
MKIHPSCYKQDRYQQIDKEKERMLLISVESIFKTLVSIKWVYAVKQTPICHFVSTSPVVP